MTSAAPMRDAQAREVLRAIGHAALALADGHTIDDSIAQRLLASQTGGTDDATLLTVPEACARLRISRWSFYELIHQNRLRTVTIGRRRFVSQPELNAFIGSLNGYGSTA
ncbi:helix-turn-helix domain-containing protein [Mycolicibacterium sphagni]|nr:helix-turn-helix domain-containing protein [Mycolicibacterium sphagni]